MQDFTVFAALVVDIIVMDVERSFPAHVGSRTHLYIYIYNYEGTMSKTSLASTKLNSLAHAGTDLFALGSLTKGLSLEWLSRG